MISLILSSSSAEISSFVANFGERAAICIAIFLRASLTSSPVLAVAASTNTPILPPAWIYGTTTPSVSILSNLLIVRFSPITAILLTNSSLTVLDSSLMNFSSDNASTVVALDAIICSAISATNVLNVSFLATKSVSEFTSTIAALLPST